MEKLVLTVKDVMALCGVSRPTATAWMLKVGTMPRTKKGALLVSRAKFEKWLENPDE